jgi:hypothetical protein
LALNFRLAVNMLQLIYALKSTTIDGVQRLPSPGVHLNARYNLYIIITMKHYIGLSFKFILKVGVEESIVKKHKQRKN